MEFSNQKYCFKSCQCILRIALVFVITSFVISNPLDAQKRRYKNQLEPESKFIAAGRNYMIETLNDTTYIAKWFYPETKQLIKRETFYKKDFTVKHGLYQFVYDDGTVVDSGAYKYNTKVGKWVESIVHKGIYENGRKAGKWTTYNDRGVKVREDQYFNGGTLQSSVLFDIFGNVKTQAPKEQNSMGSFSMVAEVLPVYGQCDGSLSRKEIKKCSKKNILTYLSSNIRYPKKSRERDVQGKAFIDFYIEKDGSVSEITPRSGVSDKIKEHCVDLIKNMGDWSPGYKNGKSIRVKYTLPITFQIL